MKRSHGRFEPKMCINGKTVGLGWCDTEEEAIEVYKNEKKKKKKKANRQGCKGIFQQGSNFRAYIQSIFKLQSSIWIIHK